jgi:TPR repeat protein
MKMETHSNNHYPILTSQVNQAMDLLHPNCKNRQARELAFSILQNAANNGDIEACWRVSAMHYIGMGTEKNLEIANSYAEIAMEKGSLDGFMWFGLSCESNEICLAFIREAEKKDILL